MYKVNGYLNKVKVFNATMAHLPRLGDNVYIGPDEDFGVVRSIIWDMRVLSTYIPPAEIEHEWTVQVIHGV